MHILIVEDDDNLREALHETLTLEGLRCVSVKNGMDALAHVKGKRPWIILSDIRMDGMSGHELLRELQTHCRGVPVILMTAYGSVQDAVSAMHQGAQDYLLKPIEPQALINKIKQYSDGCDEGNSDNPIAKDAKSIALLATAKRVANTDATVLIAGESGTGKEVLARFVHHHSQRAEKAFVAINCAAIPDNMLEATLFGYEKGAFTGALKSMPGKFEQAQGGTLLLDEISEMPLMLQAKLLRVLQEREVERLGGSKMISLDVRLIATTNRNMQASVKAGEFREDLFYRLNVFPLNLLPLRERRDDILPLANYLVAKHNNRGKPIPLDASAQSALENYSWPGNTREMDNVIQRALILQNGDNISALDCQLPEIDNVIMPDDNLDSQVKAQEFDVILDALKSQDSKKATAQKLGISERTLRYKLAKMREAGYTV